MLIKKKSLKENFTRSPLRSATKSARTTTRKRTSAAAMTESIFACKWSARIITLIHDGTNRPGEITRSLDGLTTKVMNDCLRRMLGFELVERQAYAEIPPRVEYRLTPLGERVQQLINAVEELQLEINQKRNDAQ